MSNVRCVALVKGKCSQDAVVLLLESLWKSTFPVHPPRTTALETVGLLKSQDPEAISWSGPERVHSRRVESSCSKQ